MESPIFPTWEKLSPNALNREAVVWAMVSVEFAGWNTPVFLEASPSEVCGRREVEDLELRVVANKHTGGVIRMLALGFRGLEEATRPLDVDVKQAYNDGTRPVAEEACSLGAKSS